MLQSSLDDDGGGRHESEIKMTGSVHPVSVVWPMGFSWSSAVAQASTVEICKRAGISEECFTCLESPVPFDQGELCGVATDDVILAHSCPKAALRRLSPLEAAMVAAGVQKNAEKDVNVVDSMIALVVNLRTNLLWWSLLLIECCNSSAGCRKRPPCLAKGFKFMAGFGSMVLSPAAMFFLHLRLHPAVFC